MMSVPSSDETSDQHFSLRSATVLQLQTFRVICQPQDIEKDFVQWCISPIEVQMAPEETTPIRALVGDLAILWVLSSYHVLKEKIQHVVMLSQSLF